MGNCQAVDAAALVVQHPNGRTERMYWSITASEVMKMNPGHYVSLIIPLPPITTTAAAAGEQNSSDDKIVRFTRVKLLRPNETLVLGRAYRLITTQEVMKVLKAKKYAKMKKNQNESLRKLLSESENQESNGGWAEEQQKFELQGNSQVTRRENHSQRSRGSNFGASRSKSWRPSLQSISEAAS